MKRLFTLATAVIVLLLSACTANHDRLYFVENTHLGLRAKLEPESQTPGDVNFGYKRSVATLIPCKQLKVSQDHDGDEQHVCGGDDADADNNIMSLMSSFNTRITWFEGTRITTFFATGEAATNTAKDPEAIKALATFPE